MMIAILLILHGLAPCFLFILLCLERNKFLRSVVCLEGPPQKSSFVSRAVMVTFIRSQILLVF